MPNLNLYWGELHNHNELEQSGKKAITRIMDLSKSSVR